MTRCHVELYKPGRAAMESRLLLAEPDTPTARQRMLRSRRCRRRGCFIMTHCPGKPERTIFRHDGRGWKKR